MFKVGDKVKDCYGKVGVVLSVHGNSLFTDIDSGSWLHIAKATLLAQRKGY